MYGGAASSAAARWATARSFIPPWEVGNGYDQKLPPGARRWEPDVA
jgi:hypothetical protein